MGHTFITFLFIGLSWLPSGTLDQGFAIPNKTLKACQKLQFSFEISMAVSAATQPAPMQPTWFSECKPVTNVSAAHHG
jgi:hypothetical protein